MGTRRADMSWETTTRGLADRERRSDMAVDDSSGKAAAGQGRKRGATGSGPGGRRGARGGGVGADDLTGAVERGFDPRRTHGGSAAGGAGGGGPGGQREICGGGGFWQNDNDGIDIGGRATPTPAAETGAAASGGGGGGGPGGQQEIGGGGGGDGGAAEEMDRDGADDGGGGPGWAAGTIRRVDPEERLTMATKQRKHWRKRGGRGLLGP